MFAIWICSSEFSLGPINDTTTLIEICKLNVLFCNAMVFLGTQKARAVLNDVQIGVSTMKNCANCIFVKDS